MCLRNESKLEHNCHCHFAILRLARLFFDSCFDLQPEHTVTRCRISGLHIGSSVTFGQDIGLLDSTIECFTLMK